MDCRKNNPCKGFGAAISPAPAGAWRGPLHPCTVFRGHIHTAKPLRLVFSIHGSSGTMDCPVVKLVLGPAFGRTRGPANYEGWTRSGPTGNTPPPSSPTAPPT